MKTIYKLLVLCTILLANTNFMNAQGTCTASVNYSYPISQTVTSYTADNYWFKTTIGPGDFVIMVKSANSTNKISRADVYTGTCGSLNLFDTDTLPDSGADSLFSIPISNTVSTTYYVDLSKTGTSASFTVSTSTTLAIVGDIGFCSGISSIVLSASVLSQGSAPYTYTWSPGGATTSSITVSSPTPATYTLTYHDGGGTYTTTITTFTLPASSCKTCEMVNDGSFESTISSFSGNGNVTCLPSCTPPPKPDIDKWKTPTCGTADYLNTSLQYPVSVPLGLMTGTVSLSPHSGNGYAGILVKDAVNAREYIQNYLKCPLISGLAYNVSYYVSRGTRCTYAANNLGAYLSTGTITTSGAPVLNYTPQINSTSVINNGGSWTQISGTYFASGGEQYLTIGNFYDDANTTFTTFTGNNSSGQSYYFVDDVSITPASPTVTAGSCQSGSVTITAYGAPNTTLTAWAGPSSYTATGSSITVASPTAAVTYTCTIKLSTTTCTTCSDLTQTITIQPAASCTAGVTQPGSYTPATGTTFTASPGYFANNMTIGANVTYTINSSDCRMASGINITVANGGTLTVQGSWLHVCSPCGGTMWQGIIVNNGGKLIINGTPVLHSSGNIIEDAVQAVYTSSSATATPIPIWNISNTIINNCSTGVYIDAHAGDLSSNLITSTIFTCRNIGNHSLSLTNIGNIRTNVLASTPLLPSSANPTDLTIAGTQTDYGIYLNALSSYTTPVVVGGNSSSYTYNLFDNLKYGIYAYQSSLTAINNNFQNLLGNSTDRTGIGIYSDADGGVAAAVKSILIAGNTGTTTVSGETNNFTNCLAGIYTNKMREVYINNNVFNNETTATTYSTAGTYTTGAYGVVQQGFANSAGTTDFENLQFANNSVKNCVYGHYLGFNKLYNTGSNSLYFIGNTISATLPNYCSYGIYLTQASAGSYSTVPKDALSITTNTITNVNTSAIYANAVNTSGGTGFLQIYNNGELSVKYNSANTSLSSPPVAAVSLSNSPLTRVTYNTNVRVTGVSGTTTITAQYHAGIYTSSSTGCTVNCNTVTNTGEAFVFSGTNTTSSNCWQHNGMDYCKYGFVLRSSGILGNQGSSTYPIDDLWGGTTHFSGGQTLCDNSNPGLGTTSKLYTQTVSCNYQPCANYTVNAPATAYSTGAGTLANATGSNTLTCGAAGTGDRVSTGNQGGINNTDSDSIDFQSIQNTLITDQASYPVYDYETRWGLQYFISSNRPDLLPAAGYENAKTLAMADGALANENYSTAQSLTNSFNANNTVESNWKTVLNVQIKLLNDTLNENDINTLENVASQCPASGGNIVWRARSILGTYYGKVMEYPNDCPLNNNIGERTQSLLAGNTLNKQQSINMYPNPNSGSFTINYTGSGKKLTLEVFGLMGQHVLNQQFGLTNNVNIPVSGLNEGVYFVKIIIDNIPFKTEKIIVTK